MEKVFSYVPKTMAIVMALADLGVILWQFVYNIACVVEMGGEYQSIKWISLTVLSLIPGILLAIHNSWRLAKPTSNTNWFFKAIAIFYLVVLGIILLAYLIATINWWGLMQNEK